MRRRVIFVEIALPRLSHPSLEILITLGCSQRKNRPNSMNLWQKPMSSYNKIFIIPRWPFLQIKAKGYSQIKNPPNQKTDATSKNQLFKIYNFVAWPKKIRQLQRS